VGQPAPLPSILVVEDEAPIRGGLVDLFQGQGFCVESAADGALALALVEHRSFDLVILDLMLPGSSGLTVLERIRRKGWQTAVLVLTARDTEEDVVAGIEAGADDYVTKPFGARALVARARGLLRRARPAAAERHIRVGGGVLDLDAGTFVEGGAVVALTLREAALLAHLAQPPGRIVGRAELLVSVWGYRDGGVRTRTVDVHVQQLRSKIPRGHARIATVRGRGYRLEPGE
jgi:DNA-binding response OmpR family regulator